MDHIDTLVIGAGVVGLAIARRLAQGSNGRGREVLVLEAENAPGTVTSSRNSGVIHAGLYYAPGSLKARLCVAGREKLYAYARERGIPHKNCGKLVVATDEEQIAQLRDYKKIGEQNGVTGMRMLTPYEARQMEPELFCTAALHVPVTGIVDVHPYILALEGDAESAGAMIALKTKVIGGEIAGDKFILDTEGDAPAQISCNTLINAAGLGAQAFARNLRGLNAASVPQQVLAKGNYFSLSGKQPFQMLIYPLPVLGSSGLHAFADMAGRVRFGPDVEWIDHIDYTVDPARAVQMAEAVRRYWPALPEGALMPDYSGIRPKIARGSPHDTDFIIQDAGTHGIRNLIALYGIESPGLTSSLAIGDYVADLLEKQNG
ncbi:MAG: NAD(P)/FAD-dependent oxidoreductase [Alphaproteobacteria bacterium]|nr:NAD(P)/FAD-dependent oxidoreductase [Alphaproteobacteria bacterium]